MITKVYRMNPLRTMNVCTEFNVKKSNDYLDIRRLISSVDTRATRWEYLQKPIRRNRSQRTWILWKQRAAHTKIWNSLYLPHKHFSHILLRCYKSPELMSSDYEPEVRGLIGGIHSSWSQERCLDSQWPLSPLAVGCGNLPGSTV